MIYHQHQNLFPPTFPEMSPFNISPIPISPAIRPYIRRLLNAKARIDSPADLPFYPTGYLRIPHPLKGRPRISIPDKGIFRELVEEGPYFSGIIEGDNAYIHTEEDLDWVVMEMKAGMAYYLFAIDMTNLVNTTTHFSNVSAIAGQFNREAISANSLEEVVWAFERFIEGCIPYRLPAIPYVDDAVQLIESRNGNIEIFEVLDSIRIPVSTRHFIKMFKMVIGTTPKRWCRILQIGFAVRLLESGQKLTEIALEAGFYDQAHFINTFQNFIRTTPSDFIHGKEIDLASYLLRASSKLNGSP